MPTAGNKDFDIIIIDSVEIKKSWAPFLNLNLKDDIIGYGKHIDHKHKLFMFAITIMYP